MDKLKQTRKYKNSFLNWIEYRLPIISYFEKEYGDYPMPKNANYFWSFGAISLSNVTVENLRLRVCKDLFLDLWVSIT